MQKCFIVTHCKIGVSRVYAKNKEEAFGVANALTDADIDWISNDVTEVDEDE